MQRSRWFDCEAFARAEKTNVLNLTLIRMTQLKIEAREREQAETALRLDRQADEGRRVLAATDKDFDVIRRQTQAAFSDYSAIAAIEAAVG